MDPRSQSLGDYCRGDQDSLQIGRASEGSDGTTGTGRLNGRCVYRFGVLCWVLNSRCSALVDSHACDEVPWQESGENHRRATSACLELLVDIPQQP